MNALLRKISSFKLQIYFLKVGDIIWSKRYSNLKEKNKYKIGHQESPHVIIKKTLTKIYVLTCTSNPHTEINWKFKLYPLNKLTYNLNKNTYVYTGKIERLKSDQFIKKIGHLNKYDLNCLKKYLTIVNKNKILKKKDLKFTYDVGDVISYKENKYYIYDINNKYYLTCNIGKKINKNNRLLVNNTYYTFHFNNLTKIPKHTLIKLEDTFNTGEIEIIKKQQLKNNHNNNVKNEITEGTLVLFKNKFFYIFKINEQSFEAYSILVNEKNTRDKGLILVDGGYYYTYFQSQIISKDSNLIIRRYANNKELEYNRKLNILNKNQRLKEKQQMLKKINGKQIDNFLPMSIITNIITKENYLIVSRNNNVLELININNLGEYFNFLYEENNFPYKFYRTLSVLEYEKYIQKIDELKNIFQIIKNNSPS